MISVSQNKVYGCLSYWDASQVLAKNRKEMQFRNWILGLFTYALLIILTPALGAEPAKSTRSNLPWITGESWRISTFLYSRDWAIAFSDPKAEAEKHKPMLLAMYSVLVEVIGVQEVDGIMCWQMDFTADQNAPPSIREQKWRVWVSQVDGSTKKIKDINYKSKVCPEINIVDDTSILIKAPYGFPIEFIPLVKVKKELVSKSLNFKAYVSEEQTNRFNHKKLYVTRYAKKLDHVHQKWNKGAKWWSEYLKYTEDHIELHAYENSYLSELATKFDAVYGEFRETLKEGEETRQKNKYEEIVNLGIGVLPCIVQKVKEGDASLIPAISELAGTINKNATISECLDWWEKQKTRKWSRSIIKNSKTVQRKKRPEPVKRRRNKDK